MVAIYDRRPKQLAYNAFSDCYISDLEESPILDSHDTDPDPKLDSSNYRIKTKNDVDRSKKLVYYRVIK